MEIKELVQLQKLLNKFWEELYHNDALVSPLAFVIKSIKQELNKKHKLKCNNCWKQGNYDLFKCPTKEKCILERDYSPKGPELKIKEKILK